MNLKGVAFLRIDLEKSYKKYKPLLSNSSLGENIYIYIYIYCLISNTRHRLAKDTCKEAVLYFVSLDETLEELKSILSILLMHKNKLLTFQHETYFCDCVRDRENERERVSDKRQIKGNFFLHNNNNKQFFYL